MRETYLPRDEVVVLVYIFCGGKKKKESVFVIQPTLSDAIWEDQIKETPGSII